MAQEPELLPFSLPYSPSTPIAAELREHFARGGSVAGAVRLVEALEQSALRAKSKGLPAKKSTERGTRLSPDWRPSHSDIRFALERGLPSARIDTEAEKFRNYWVAKSGADACKRDWAACWRNWIINSTERYGYERSNYRKADFRADPAARRSLFGSDAIIAGMGRVADRINERRATEVSNGRPLPLGADLAGQADVKPRATR